MTESVQTWLQQAPEPYIRYQVLDFLGRSPDESVLYSDPFISENIRLLHGLRNEVLNNHSKAGLFIHRLSMLADLGVTAQHPEIAKIAETVLSSTDKNGALLSNIMIPTHFGGSGEPSPEWIICDFPVLLYSLIKIGAEDVRLEAAEQYLIELAGEEFYPCCGSIPKFKGPGPRGGMCPYANLLAVKALSASSSGRKSEAAAKAAEAVLGHWEIREEKKYFLFGIGTDFKKLKLPYIWYNLLHVLKALKPLPGITDDPRYGEMLEILKGKFDADGKLTAESIYMAYKKEEWSSKNQPSRLLTLEGLKLTG